MVAADGGPVSRWLRALVAGLSGIFGMYLGGLLGVIVAIAFFDSPESGSGGFAGGLDLFAGLLFAVVLTIGAAFVVWLVGPTIVGAVMKWPRVGTAFVMQLLAGVFVIIPSVVWLLTQQDDVSNASLWVPVVVGHVLAGALPAASRWLVDSGAS